MVTSSQIALLKKAGLQGRKYLAAAIAKDEAARYSLKEDWMLPFVPYDLGDYEDEAFSIASQDGQSLIMVKAFDSTAENALCDGATHAPDKVLGVNFVPSAIFHDRWYSSIPGIAAATGKGVAELRKIGDTIFVMIAYAENNDGIIAKTVISAYYYGIRLFGGGHVPKLLKRVTAAVLAAVLLGGCGGCANFVFPDEGEYEPPAYEEVQTENGGN